VPDHTATSSDKIRAAFHDLNNTLGAILMNLDILRERAKPGSQERVAADSAIGQAVKLESQLKELRVTVVSKP
jgi:hypothetical protein